MNSTVQFFIFILSKSVKFHFCFLLNTLSPHYSFIPGSIKTIRLSPGCLTKLIYVCSACSSPLLCVLRERGNLVSVRMEGLRHHPLLLLHRHHPPRCGAGVSPGRKTPTPPYLCLPQYSRITKGWKWHVTLIVFSENLYKKIKRPEWLLEKGE